MFDKPYSDETARIIDEEVKRIIDDVRERARKLLVEKGDYLERMAQALLEKEVLGPKELVGLLGTRPYGDYVSFNGKGTKARGGGREVDTAMPAAGESGDGAADLPEGDGGVSPVLGEEEESTD